MAGVGFHRRHYRRRFSPRGSGGRCRKLFAPKGIQQRRRSGSDAGKCTLWPSARDRAGNCYGSRACSGICIEKKQEIHALRHTPETCISMRQVFSDSMSTVTGSAQHGTPRFGRIDAAMEAVQAAITRSRDYIFSIQHHDGFWCGELEADSMLEADYIFVHRFLGTGDEARLKRALTEMLRFQNDDGSWSIYPGGPGNISL